MKDHPTKTSEPDESTAQAEAGRLDPSAAHGVMFWFLMLLAFSVFAPCVLIPAWDRYAEVYKQEQVMAARVAALEAVQGKQERTITALRTDPAVNERVAMRELGYRKPGQKLASVAGEEAGEAEWIQAVEPITVEVTPTGPALPPEVARVTRFLPALPFREVFCESPTREVCLAMSIGLMALAFWLYATPGRSESGVRSLESGVRSPAVGGGKGRRSG